MEQQSHVHRRPKRVMEVMARIFSDDEFEKYMSVAKVITGSSSELIEQRDVCFNSPNGRFNLHYLPPPKRTNLVYYESQEFAGNKLPKCNKIDLSDAEVMEKILTQTNGVRGVLEKRRHLFVHGTTRIHLDKVKDLGNFMFIEVCLMPEQSLEEGKIITDKLMAEFGIKDEDLMTGEYYHELCNSMNY